MLETLKEKLADTIGSWLCKTDLVSLAIRRILQMACASDAGPAKMIGLLVATHKETGEVICARMIVQRSDGDHFPTIPETKINIEEA